MVECGTGRALEGSILPGCRGICICVCVCEHALAHVWLCSCPACSFSAYMREQINEFVDKEDEES